MMRADKERIIIRSALAGIFLFIIATVLRQWFTLNFPCSDNEICLTTLWRSQFAAEAEVPVLAFFLGFVAWIPLNILPWYWREKQIERAIDEDADPLEILLLKARKEELPVAITLQSGKVYIAKVTRPFNAATPTESIGLIPLSSGFRDGLTKGLVLTTSYTNVIAQITERRDLAKLRIERLQQQRKTAAKTKTDTRRIDRKLAAATLGRDRFETQIGMFFLVLPVSQITSICFFDSEIHVEFFQTAPIPSEETAPSPN